MKSIAVIQDYPQVKIRLKEIMDNKNINRNMLYKATNLRYEVLNKWITDNVERLDLDVLSRLCYVLECQISDILTLE